MFNPDPTVLIAAHKYTGAQEIMTRIPYVYETCPDFIRAGVTSYNKGSIEFENGSRIMSATTTGNTGRGMSAHHYYIVMSLRLYNLRLQMNFGHLPSSH